MEVNNNILLIVVNPQGIFNQHIGPHLINITIIMYCVLLNYLQKNEDPTEHFEKYKQLV